MKNPATENLFTGFKCQFCFNIQHSLYIYNQYLTYSDPLCSVHFEYCICFSNYTDKVGCPSLLDELNIQLSNTLKRLKNSHAVQLLSPNLTHKNKFKVNSNFIRPVLVNTQRTPFRNQIRLYPLQKRAFNFLINNAFEIKMFDDQTQVGIFYAHFDLIMNHKVRLTARFSSGKNSKHCTLFCIFVI